MLNPWVILGLVLFFAGTNFWSFHEGEKQDQLTVKAATAAAAAKAASDARADAAIDYGVQQDIALDQQRHELLEETHHNVVVTAIASDKARRVQQAASGVAVDCNATPATFSVLLDSIRASNQGAFNSPGAGNGAVSGSNGASGPVAGSDAVRTGQHGVDPLNLPK